MYQISAAPLEKICVKPKFLVLQLVLIISNFQHVIISFFVLGTVVPCDPPLSAKANGDRQLSFKTVDQVHFTKCMFIAVTGWHHMLLICEMAALSFVARHYYRRHMDIPYEDRIRQSLVDNQTGTTASLERQPHNYGTSHTCDVSTATASTSTSQDIRKQSCDDVMTATTIATPDDVVVKLDNITQSMSSA